MKKEITTGLATLILATQLAACSSGSPPRHELALTQTSIRSAQAAGAETYASQPLRAAQQKVAQAQRLIDKKNYDEAKRLLHLANADAELAEATAQAEKSAFATQEVHKSIDLMKKEIARAQEN